MENIQLQEGLPFVPAIVRYNGRDLIFDHVLLDTGSAGSIFSTDRLLDVGLTYEPEDTVHRISGVGGTEFVFGKRIDTLKVGELTVDGFEIEVGVMDYGIELDGILGMDFLTQVGAVIDLDKLIISKPV